MNKSRLYDMDKGTFLRLWRRKGLHYIADKYDVEISAVRRFRKRHFANWRPPGKCKKYLDKYYVYENGKVWSTKIHEYVRPDVYGRYAVMMLNKRKIKLHRLLLTVFKRPPLPGEVGRHLDGDVSHNHIKNLRWGTSKQNRADSRRHGTEVKGSDSPNAVLNERHVQILRKRYFSGEKSIINRYRKRYGTSYAAVYAAVVTQTSWKHVSW